ncbi:DUF3263 domain-containing protein [Streptomyces sp. SP18CS02]|uniref:DUF3263 domain-containing protein n=1 Tax=Streptomyces sp. SP18CS02 TaxID=3002531 RepID=UPI002E759B5B|nr:DUF3263 domain-containing protein [Streptomyces sp. SP18CS02]MEE1755653.1 DUF3263 domain-containing protein [Streptomyces sp. SP18CS02]
MTADPDPRPDARSEAGSEPEAEAGSQPEPEPEAGPVPASAAPSGLTGRDRAVLAMERRSWPGPGAKERAIREQLGFSPVRYYQLLNALLDDPRALAHDPVTVNRLRRMRESREARR